MSESAARVEALRRRMAEDGLKALYVSALPNIRYLTGFTGSAGSLLVTPDEVVLVTDGRYRTQAGEQTENVDVVIADRGPLATFSGQLELRGVKKLAFERNRLSYQAYEGLRQAAPKRRLIPADGLVEELRAVKSAAEIDRIRRSVELNSEAFEAVCSKIRPSWTERRTAAELEYQMRRLGAEGPSFDTIVASGEHSALPHAQPRQVRLRPRSLIVVDMGAILDGYASDMTRMIALGSPGPTEKKMFAAVLEAQAVAIDAVKAGIQGGTVDRKARTTLKKHGLEKQFVHSTGHGLGLEIHEDPRLGQGVQRRLEEGMVVTIEPGVYLEGLGGVRIEDVVVVKRGGCEVLTQTSRDLRII